MKRRVVGLLDRAGTRLPDPIERLVRRVTAAVARLLVRVWRPIERRIRVDTRSLAAFRMLAGLLIVVDVLLRSRNFHRFYTEEGVVPRELAQAMSYDGAFSIYHYTTDPTIIALLFAITVLVGLQLIVGYKTRLASVLAFVLVVSLDHHNPLVLSYADTLFRMLLFWAMFLPLGERWSIDAMQTDRAPRKRFVGVASLGIMLQMVAMYTINGLHKSEDELWTGGDATIKVMGLDDMSFLAVDILREFPELLVLGGLTWYYMLLGSALLILLAGRLRLPLVAAFMIGHLSFAITVRIGAFPWVALAGLLPFLGSVFWDDARAILRYVGVYDPARKRLGLVYRVGDLVPSLRFGGRRVRRVRSGLYTLTVLVLVFSLVLFTVLTYLPVAGVNERQTAPEYYVEHTASTMNVDQPEWGIFAPTPRSIDRYYVFPAQTADGDVIDVQNDGRELTYERPHDFGELHLQYDTYRERFYMNSVRRGGNDNDVAPTLAEYICETWEDDHGEELTHISMYSVNENVTTETYNDVDERVTYPTFVYNHGCGDEDPMQVDRPPRNLTDEY